MQTQSKAYQMSTNTKQIILSIQRIFILLGLAVFSFTPCFGQSEADTIAVEKKFGGYRFSQDGKVLTLNQLSNILKSNPQAYQEMKTAKSSYAAAMVISYAGGFLVGWPIGTALGGGEANWTLAAIGAGLIAVSIPISQGFNKRARQAVDTFNGGQLPNKSLEKGAGQLNVSLNGNGAGLIFRF